MQMYTKNIDKETARQLTWFINYTKIEEIEQHSWI